MSYILMRYDVCFVLDQHAELDFFSASSLKQQSVDRRHMMLHSDTLSWLRAKHSLHACLLEKQQIEILQSLVWSDVGSNPWSTTLEAIMLIITPPMWFNEILTTMSIHTKEKQNVPISRQSTKPIILCFFVCKYNTN